MKRKERLTKSADFERVRRFGKFYAHPILLMYAVQNQEDLTRFGVVAGRTVGRAVKRNRAKRLLRAAIQSRQAEISPGWDIVLYARSPIVGASFEQVQVVMTSLLTRAHLMQEVHDQGTLNG